MKNTQLLSRRGTLFAALGAAPLLDGPAAAQSGSPQSISHYDVKQFGASGRKEDKATKAFQAAIDAASAAGGGTVYVSPGAYTCGPVDIKSNVTVHLDAGATVFVSRDPADYRPGRRRALFNATDVQNIALTGKGRIDGQGTWEWRLPDTHAYTTRPIQAEIDIARQAGLDMRYYHTTGPAISTVAFTRATNVLIEDVTMVNSSGWCMPLTECDRVFIRGVHLYSDLDKAVNSDGIDLVSSRNVLISDCVLVTADDCISLKTRKNGTPIENVTVTNCLLTSSSSAFVIGVETWADIHHVMLTNSVIRNANRGFRIAVWNGGTVSDVIFSDLVIDLNRRHYNWWGNAETFQFVVWQETPDSPLGLIRDVTVDRIISRARGTSGVIGPTDQRRLENVRISNVHTTMLPENTADKRSTHALRVEGVRGFHLRDFSVKWDEEKPEPKWANAVILKGIDDFEIAGVSGRQGLKDSQSAAIVLEDAADGIVRDSRATAGCGTFMEIRGERCRNLSAFNNDLSKAAKKYELASGASRNAVRFGPPAD
jgi:hypothetical protein